MSLVGSIDLVTYIIRMDQVLRLPREIPLCLKGWEVLSPARSLVSAQTGLPRCSQQARLKEKSEEKRDL